MSVTIARAPHFVLRRVLAVLAIAAIVAVVVAATVHASQTTVHVQVLRGGTQQVSGFDGGAPLAPANSAVGQ